MSTKRKIIMPTEEEDAAITAAALSDPDAQPLTDADLAQFRPARQRGRPTKANPKVPVNLRLDAEVVDAFKATGDGWQTRINAVLLAHLAKERNVEQWKATLIQMQEQIASRMSVLEKAGNRAEFSEELRKAVEALTDTEVLAAIRGNDNSYALAS